MALFVAMSMLFLVYFVLHVRAWPVNKVIKVVIKPIEDPEPAK